MKVKLLILLSFVSGLLIAQSKKEFPDDMELLGLKIEAVVKADNQPSSALLYNRFLDRYVKFDTVEVSNLARLLNNLKFNTKIDRNEYLLVIETIVKLDSASFLNRHSLNDYLSAYNKDVELFKSKNQKIAYVRDNYHIVLNRSFPGKKDLFWNSSKPLFFKPVKGSVAFEFDDVLLQGKRGAEVINFKNFKGNYLVYNRQFILKESVINWDEKFFSPDSLRVDLRNITFSADDGSIDIDTCVLNSLYFTKGKILGKLKLKLQSEESNAAVYPFFESHSYDFEYINMVDQVDFTGGIRITKNLFYGVSPKDSRAKLVLKRGGERKIVLQSKGFIFKHKNLQSISSDISIVIKEDSIYHPDVSFNYMVDQGKLVVMKTDSKMSNSAYSNSYSNLDMFIKNLTWIRDRDKVYFNTEDYNRIPFVSGKYFEREIVKRFQGVNHTNPLEKLQEVSSYYWEQDYYSSQNVADYMRMPKTYAVHMIMDLASLGYLIYDQDLDRFKFTPKFDHLVDSYKNRVDYDVITFETAEGASSRGQIDLQSGETLLLGIDRANLSNTKQVYVFPSDSVKVRENLNFAFNGDIIVGNYEFHGSDYNFDYEDFKIKMNGNQRLEFYVPSWKANSNGQYAMVKVRNPIDSIRGELFIDNPSNKSGRFKLDEFPIFNNTQQAYVFYDQKSIKDCVYTRQRLFVKLYPFELDSLNYKSSRDVSFQASLYAKDIFPVFDHQLSVQSDYVLGFQYDTDSLGLPLYEKGNFTHRLSLDGSGLNGIGKVDYLSSSFLSNQIEIYSDSLRSKTISYRIDKVKNSQLDFPPIAAKNVDVLWRPKQDSVYLRPLRQDFEMYQGSVKKSGELLIADKRLSGGGKVSFETAELNSKSYNFYSDNFESDTLDFKLRDNVRSPFKFAIKNAKGKVDLLNREGVFALNQKLEKIHFIQNKYLAQMDQVNWHIDQKSIDLRASDMVQDPKFTSTSPKLDSLSFSARIARYDLVKDRISASMVENLYVADAQIIPDSARLDIMDNGWMEGFENAILRIGIGKYEHRLTNANVIVESANKYTAKAEYFYIDVDKIVHPIHLSDIYVDNNQKTVANGIINFEDNFMLNPYFKYYGKVQVTGKSPLNNFEGFVGIVNNC